MPLEKSYKKVILLVIDGFGVGAMEDVVVNRPNDIGSNTALHVLSSMDIEQLPGFEKLGLLSLLNLKQSTLPYIIGKANLSHYGADSYYGHQEIMGSKPLMPSKLGFNYYIDEIEKLLILNGHVVKRIGDKTQLLLIDDAFTIGDNIETDPGLAFNITADLNKISFTKLKSIALDIRAIIAVPRLIVFGSKETNINKIIDAIEYSDDQHIGVNAPKSGVYTDSYECVHLGYGVDYKQQTSQLLIDNGYKVSLVGKAADVIVTDGAKYLPEVNTNQVFDKLIGEIPISDFIFANVQETDLAGHAQNLDKFQKLIKIIDQRLVEVMDYLEDDSLLIVMADHGDDPLIGHAMHTREQVPLLLFNKKNTQQINLGVKDSMNYIGDLIIKILK